MSMLGGLLIPGLLGVPLSLPSNRHIVLWPHPALSFCFAIISLTLVALYVLSFKNRNHGGLGLDRIVHILSPLALLPLGIIGFFLGPFLPSAFSSNFLFFLSLGLMACVLLRWSRSWIHEGIVVTSRLAWWTGFGIGLFYALIGWYFTASVGPHSGDEGHYIIQAESLFQDHDLDLRNNLGWADEAKKTYLHISTFSRDGHWYSWHSFGLSLLMAPFVPGGVPARHLILGLLSGLCCAGVLELCRLFRARRDWSLLALLLFSGSLLWGVYSSRALPEVAGAAAATWAVVAILSQGTSPWGSGGMLLISCGALLWLHTRFIPVSLAAAGLYGLVALRDPQPFSAKFGRLLSLGVLYLGVFGFFFAVQRKLFEGGMPIAVGKMFFANPLQMWHILASNQGLLSVLPLFAWMAAATLYTSTEKEYLQSTLVVISMFFVVLITSCATNAYGGSSLPGRFLVVVLPLLIPCMARALARTDNASRWWLMFLGLISCALFFLMILKLPDFKKSFIDPWGSVVVVYPLLEGLIKVFASPPNSIFHPYAILLLAGTGGLLFVSSLSTAAPDRITLRQFLAWGLVAAMIGGFLLPNFPKRSYRVSEVYRVLNASRLKAMGPGLEKAQVQAWGSKTIEDLFQVSDRLSRLKIPSVTTEDLGVPYRGRWVSQPRIDINDWAGRGYRWVTLVRPFPASRGEYACRIKGRIIGGAKAYWTIREGEETRIEGPLLQDETGYFQALARARYRGIGTVRILVRIGTSEGTMQDLTVSWTPVSEGLLKGASLSLTNGNGI
jgi:hypothetical protein